MFTDFYEAWNWLYHHPHFACDGFAGFFSNLCVEVVKVNPETDSVDDDKEKNTKVQIWLEVGPWSKMKDPLTGKEYNQACHDILLDSGGDTYEEAIIEMANKVVKHCGNYTEEVAVH